MRLFKFQGIEISSGFVKGKKVAGKKRNRRKDKG